MSALLITDGDSFFTYRLKKGERAGFEPHYANLTSAGDRPLPVLISVDYYIEKDGVKRQLHVSEMRRVKTSAVERYRKYYKRAKIRASIQEYVI